MSEEFEELLVGNAQSLSNTANANPPTGEALGVKLALPEGEPVQVQQGEKPPTLLWNRKPPQYQRQQELPWHRTALEMAAQGYTALEIAARIGCSPVTIQDILRQPQYQQTQVDIIRRSANEDHEVLELVKGNVAKAVKTLASIVDDKQARNSDRIAAARELLDRRYGKPNQPMNRGTDVDLNNLSDKELAAMLPAATTTGTNS